MSKYQFCLNCKFIKNREVPSIQWTIWDRKMVIETSCPARFNPYEPVMDNEDKTKKNYHACPRNEQFMIIERRKQDADRVTNL